jgi:hypothetical protein
VGRLETVVKRPHSIHHEYTARLDARFKERAKQVLWCYANAAFLAEQGIRVVYVDKIPTFQVLERNPIHRAFPRSIKQQGFDYVRHGAFNHC